MAPWTERPAIGIDYSLPRSIRYRELEDKLGVETSDLLAAMRASFPKVSRRALMLGRVVDFRTRCRFHREAVALANIVGVDWRELMLAAVSYDYVLAHIACSTVALATNRGPLIARNMDWWPERELARASFVFCHFRRSSHTYVAGWPGAIGVVTGMSDRGFAFAMNAVTAPEGLRRTGYPVMLFLRRVLEDAASFDEALDMLARQRLASGCLVTLVGESNHQRVCVERRTTEAQLRWPDGDEPLVTTNEYRKFESREAYPLNLLLHSSCGRYDALRELTSGLQGDADDEQLLYILTDSRIRMGITAQHVIMRPSENAIRLFAPTDLLEDAPSSDSTSE